jgi:hypothetical protein
MAARECAAGIETYELQVAEFFRDFVPRHRLVHYLQQALQQFKRASFPSAIDVVAGVIPAVSRA